MTPARLLRPRLSLRYQHLQKLAVSTQATVATPSTPATAPSHHPSSLFRRNRGRVAWIVTALGAGVIAGNFISHTIAPPELPDAGTPGDKVLIADLNRRIDNEFKVKVLRGKCLGASRQLAGQQGGWVELVKDEKETEDLMNCLAGAKALGVQRLFWNREKETLVAIIFFGGSVSGWPGVTHGGMIATQMVEKIGIMAALMHGAHHQVSAAAAPQRLPGSGSHAKMMLPPGDVTEPEELSLSYVKPTYANGFYVVRVAPALPLDRDPADIIPGEPASGYHDYEATLETMDARILVKAKAKVAASKLQRAERKVEEAAKWTSDQFKQWMWPSRQQTSPP
ncbi:hypothetical protein AMS68_006383 [Peltaster fructicola]|uniref:Thioesterase domain-containing protein n=1 Tax=Peltaster fructicola TaxID=286661 RepID=A0A6H0Y1P8_9PEZI|nr:hypothetical protein AMS68_006383 [Peltaster fructicola]